MVLVVTTLVPRDPADVAGAEKLGSDLLELRLEHLDEEQIPEAIELAGRPVLATCRRAEDGADVALDEAQRRRRLEAAIEAGAALVDVEHDAAFRQALTTQALIEGVHVVVSEHDLEGTPSIEDGLERLGSMGGRADVVKLATRVDGPADVERLFHIARRAPTLGTPFSVMGVGDAAVRAAAGPLGMALVYTTPGSAGVPGQLPTKLQLELPTHPPPPEGFRDYVLLGHPVSHSLSPIMQNSAFAYLGEGARYRLVDVPPDGLEAAIEGLRVMGVAGGNATAPHKQALFERCASVRPAAEACGAVNSFRFDGDRLIGDMTDGTGAVKALNARGEALHDRPALLVGAGGTAHAVAHAFTDAGAELTIANRTDEKANRLADEVGAETLALDGMIIEDALPDHAVVFNATPVDPPLLDETLERTTVFDATYGPGRAELARRAELVGTRALDGLDLLIHQGDLALRFWLDRAADADLLGVMSTAARTGELEMRYRRDAAT